VTIAGKDHSPSNSPTPANNAVTALPPDAIVAYRVAGFGAIIVPVRARAFPIPAAEPPRSFPIALQGSLFLRLSSLLRFSVNPSCFFPLSILHLSQHLSSDFRTLAARIKSRNYVQRMPSRTDRCRNEALPMGQTGNGLPG
jgi:hypothetical protein